MKDSHMQCLLPMANHKKGTSNHANKVILKVVRNVLFLRSR